ncbi:MAG TPA: hypothetical protein VMX77_02310 [Candidatus Bathyarchaeia archaeon]|nr:hypothetical protein [Candidatus Bathyarchaeia archaeon]
MVSLKERIAGVGSRFRREGPKKAVSEPVKRLRDDEKIRQEASLSMRETIIANQARLLAQEYPQLKARIPQEEGEKEYSLLQIGSLLTSFGKTKSEEGQCLRGIACLDSLEGEGLLEARTRLCWVVSRFHPITDVRRSLVAFIGSWPLVSESARVELLEWTSQHDEANEVKDYAASKLAQLKP